MLMEKLVQGRAQEAGAIKVRTEADGTIPGQLRVLTGMNLYTWDGGTPRYQHG